jgi:hypothetical protein
MATGWTAGVEFPAGSSDISLLHSVQTWSGDHTASHPMDTGRFFSGMKLQGREADYLAPSNVEVKNGGATSPHHNTS